MRRSRGFGDWNNKRMTVPQIVGRLRDGMTIGDRRLGRSAQADGCDSRDRALTAQGSDDRGLWRADVEVCCCAAGKSEAA